MNKTCATGGSSASVIADNTGSKLPKPPIMGRVIEHQPLNKSNIDWKSVYTGMAGAQAIVVLLSGDDNRITHLSDL